VNALPQQIAALLQKGVQEIDSQGELPSRFRSELYLQIEAASAPEHENAGYYRRARVELGCAYKVLPMLQPEPQTHEAARSRLAMSELAFRRAVDLETLDAEASELGRMLDDAQFDDAISLPMMYAGYASVAALKAVAYDVDASIAAITEKSRNHETWNACFHASLAVAGGATWEGANVDNEKRRDFWIWYLQVLVPELWSPFAKPEDIVAAK
jgi:hypothetical protein